MGSIVTHIDTRLYYYYLSYTTKPVLLLLDYFPQKKTITHLMYFISYIYVEVDVVVGNNYDSFHFISFIKNYILLLYKNLYNTTLFIVIITIMCILINRFPHKLDSLLLMLIECTIIFRVTFFSHCFCFAIYVCVSNVYIYVGIGRSYRKSISGALRQ